MVWSARGCPRSASTATVLSKQSQKDRAEDRSTEMCLFFMFKWLEYDVNIDLNYTDTILKEYTVKQTIQS